MRGVPGLFAMKTILQSRVVAPYVLSKMITVGLSVSHSPAIGKDDRCPPGLNGCGVDTFDSNGSSVQSEFVVPILYEDGGHWGLSRCSGI
jgi:hypothetical protein